MEVNEYGLTSLFISLITLNFELLGILSSYRSLEVGLNLPVAVHFWNHGDKLSISYAESGDM